MGRVWALVVAALCATVTVAGNSAVTQAGTPPVADRSAVQPVRSSHDRALATVGDANGLHVLVADESNGYAWRDAASLAEPGVDSDQWIGQACLTESTRRAVVVYAPRSFSNDPLLTLRGAFAAVVDLDSGRVRKLPVRTSLAYFNPGCGAGESAVLTQEGDEQQPGTRLFRLDAGTGRLAAPIVTATQVSSAVPARDGIVAAGGNALVRIAPSGAVRGIVRASGTPYDLTVDASGAVVHADHTADTVRVRRTLGATTTTVGTGRLAAVGVQRGGHGQVFVTGPLQNARSGSGMPTLLRDASPAERLSSSGHLALRPAREPRLHTAQLAGRMTATGKNVAFNVPVAPERPARSTTASPALADTPVDTDRTCSIPRNDVNRQVYQPTPRQAEWAVDNAVRHALTDTRPANWHHDGIGAYSPQGMFPAPGLAGVGVYMPAQIMLGVLAQESNMAQASWHAMSGEYANPLVGNFYGTKANGWDIDFAKSDCGYGISQVTDGMRVGQRPIAQQTAIALDYAANIAAGVQILESKWNQLFAHGMLVNGGDPRWIENWYLALWAYNSGYHELGDPKTDGTVSGLGWLNNPANPHYPQNRAPFLEYGYGDAAHPQDWPYQEKVIGWAGHPIATLDGAGYRAAWWVSVEDRIHAQPPPSIACTDSNECQYGSEFPPNDPGVIGEPAGPCAHKSPAGKYNLQCFWHSSMEWKDDCSDGCGHELERFDPGQYPEQPDGTHYPPQCSRGDLPGNAIVVDDLAASTPSASCSSRASNSGTFGLQFGTDANGHHPAKIDLHQLGGGWGGHFWFAHTWENNAPMSVTGTWTPASRLSGWTRVLVHIPDHGALTQQAHYRIHLGNGQVETRVIPTDIEANSWVSLGVFNFVAGTDNPRLELDNDTNDGDGTSDVAWDAAAFAHLPGKPRDVVVQLGDSYSSGQGAGHYEAVSNRGLPDPGNRSQTGTPTWNACRRSKASWARKAVLPGTTASTGQRADSYDVSLDYHSVACSGAITRNVDSNLGRAEYGHPGQHHEVAQLDSGFLDTNTTLVELTLGGNDVKFGDTLEACSIEPGQTCPSYEELLPQIDELADPLTTVLKDINAKAPHAKIVLLGYPELFGANPPDTCATVVLNREYQQRLNDWADYLSMVQDGVVQRLEQSIPVEYYYPGSVTEFGAHELCDQEPALNDLVDGPHNGPADYTCPGSVLCVSMESFHPNELGTTIYARALQNALKP